MAEVSNFREPDSKSCKGLEKSDVPMALQFSATYSIRHSMYATYAIIMLMTKATGVDILCFLNTVTALFLYFIYR